ncbi:hypothetical protein [Streptomyces sp. NPDC058694]|uniref:hypothetical protein n=1 Tax=Streptomyces sp. NPDC058694 TaxID=3346603 RepID=UPI00365ABD39
MDQDQRRARIFNMRKARPIPHIPTTPAPATVYFIESRPAPSQPWQQASGVQSSWESKDKALERLAARREMQPGWEHRLMERITTVTERPATDA